MQYIIHKIKLVEKSHVYGEKRLNKLYVEYKMLSNTIFLLTKTNRLHSVNEY